MPLFSKIGVCGLFATALLYQKLGVKETVCVSNKHVYLVLIGVFIIHLVAGINTEAVHSKAFWSDIALQLPFLLMPLSFALLPTWPSSYLRRLYLLFFCLVVLSAAASTVHYLQHTVEINKLYSQSQIMPTVPDYIRFSLMVTFATVIGTLYSSSNGRAYGIRLSMKASTGFLVLYLYLLAVRSGLGAFTILGILSVGWLIIKKRRYRQGALLGILLVVMPSISFLYFPTFRNKYYNTEYDVAHVKTTSSANNLSLVGRYYSYQVGVRLVQKNPWFGVGKADMKKEIGHFYQQDYPDIDPSSYLMPHNQFLYCCVAFGGIGLLIFSYSFYYPLFRMRQQASFLFIAHYIIVSLSFIAEFTLDQESQIGILYTLIFILLSLASFIQAGQADPILNWGPYISHKQATD
ncbi:O-antigen ligase family protein [Hymenobacter crusticola]|nr:O-antigen ligase family protein [Hymenobacter crusticola]